MAVGYIAVALLVIALNITEIPGVIALIVKSAFGLEPLVGGGIGAAIMMGLKRGLFSNEAGLGSAPRGRRCLRAAPGQPRDRSGVLGVYRHGHHLFGHGVSDSA